MTDLEAGVLIEMCLEEVKKQYILPLSLALGTLTVAVCHDKDIASAVAGILRDQADSCPLVPGKIILEGLAHLAADSDVADPAAVQKQLHSFLRLVPKREEEKDTP